MKKRLLPVMIIGGLFGLSACDDQPDAQATAKAAQTAKQEVVKKAVTPTTDQATQAEEAFKATTAATQTYYQMLLTSHPIVQSLSYVPVSYEKGTDTSTAITKGTLKLSMDIDGTDSLELLFKHTIKHDTTTAASGLVARIDSRIEKPADSKLGLNQLIDNFSYKTDIQSDGKLTQVMLIKPLNFTDPDSKAMFNGLEITSKSTIKNIAGGFFDNSVIDFKGATLGDNEETFNIKPLKLTAAYKPSGEFNINNSNPLVMGNSETYIQISNISGSGTVSLNKPLNIWLGKQNYQLKDIQITSPEAPAPLTIESAMVDVDTHINTNKMLTQSMKLSLVPAAGLVSMLSQGMLDVTQADISYQLNDVPAELLKQYNNMMSGLYDELGVKNTDDTENHLDKADKQLENMFNTAKSQGSNLALNLSLTAAEGPANVDAKVAILPDSPVAFADLENLNSPAEFFSLLNVNANASLPAALLEKTGIHMMAGPFLQKEGETYRATVTTENGQLLINGIPAPL